jgi:hypothetical protein
MGLRFCDNVLDKRYLIKELYKSTMIQNDIHLTNYGINCTFHGYSFGKLQGYDPYVF